MLYILITLLFRLMMEPYGVIEPSRTIGDKTFYFEHGQHMVSPLSEEVEIKIINLKESSIKEIIVCTDGMTDPIEYFMISYSNKTLTENFKLYNLNRDQNVLDESSKYIKDMCDEFVMMTNKSYEKFKKLERTEFLFHLSRNVPTLSFTYDVCITYICIYIYIRLLYVNIFYVIYYIYT